MSDRKLPESIQVTRFPPHERPLEASVTPRNDAGDGKLAVIVVNYAAHQLIEQNLGAAGLDPSQVRVVLVDNFSSAQEAESVTTLAAAHGWDLLRLAENRGFGCGVNAGVDEAIRLGSERFILINPDARIDATVVAALGHECQANPMAMVAPRILASDGKLFFDGAVVDLAKGRVRGLGAVSEVSSSTVGLTGRIDGELRRVEPWLTGACLALSIDLYDRIGGMDDSFFLYWEDVDLSYRVRRAGGSLIVRHDLTVVHDEGGTQGPRVGRAKSELYYYFNCRNRLLFAANHLPKRELARWMMGTPGASWAILMQGGRRQLLDSPRLGFAALRGSCSGLGLAVRALFRSDQAQALDPSQDGVRQLQVRQS